MSKSELNNITDDAAVALAAIAMHKAEWQDSLRDKVWQAIREGRSQRTVYQRFSDYALSLNSQDRMPNLIDLWAELQPPTFWRAMRAWWNMCDCSWDYGDAVLNLLRRHAATAPARKNRQGTNETAIYRGCSRSRILGVSWTTDIEVARGFARGHRHIPITDPVIASAVVSRDGIFMRINSRKEREVLVDPAGLSNVQAERAHPMIR
jgi:hypothetical protein